MADDPLDAIEHFPVETQVAIIISVLRTTRNQLGRIERKLDWVGRSIWALIATITAGVVVYYVTVGTHPAKTGRSQAPLPKASVISRTPRTPRMSRAAAP